MEGRTVAFLERSTTPGNSHRPGLFLRLNRGSRSGSGYVSCHAYCRVTYRRQIYETMPARVRGTGVLGMDIFPRCSDGLRRRLRLRYGTSEFLVAQLVCTQIRTRAAGREKTTEVNCRLVQNRRKTTRLSTAHVWTVYVVLLFP